NLANTHSREMSQRAKQALQKVLLSRIVTKPPGNRNDGALISWVNGMRLSMPMGDDKLSEGKAAA
ncbi:MAG: hypothetical protein WCE88_07380, partial [Burkholderiales bacterium]